MQKFKPKTVCILGRQPSLGLAELESLYGAEHVRPGPVGTALLDIDGFEINFKNLGGTIKVARLLDFIESNKWSGCLKYLKQKVPEKLNTAPNGKFTLGVSLYGFDENTNQLNRDLLGLKKVVKATGRSIRLVPNKSPALSSAQVLHNKLTKLGASELLLIKDGQTTIFAQTLFVQDIDAYAARDQARPARDAKIGMLPPKLAQIIINLAVDERHAIDRHKAGQDHKSPHHSHLTVLDPFCGSGVILQEALLMGFAAVGSDIDKRMIEFAETNLDWLAARHEIADNQYSLLLADGTSYNWHKFDTIASELYLGRPLAKIPSSNQLKTIMQDVNTITEKFLRNLNSQLKKGQRICIAVPAWIGGQMVHHLPLIDSLDKLGYNRYDFVHVWHKDLLYFREGQIVARELLVLERL